MATTRGKLLALALSTAVSVGIGWAVLSGREANPDSVRTVDTGDELERMMAERNEAAPPADAGPARDPDAPYPPPLVREPLPEEVAAEFFPALGSKQWVYDPRQYVRRAAHVRTKVQVWREHPDRGYRVVTNRLGMREDTDPSATKPDLRVLVAGDSHVDGVCNNAETYPAVLEGLLAAEHPERTVEALNAAVGGTNLYNYVGVFERFREELDPDAFVVTVYGGNDFSSAVVMQRWFERLPPIRREPYVWSSKTLKGGDKSIGNQEYVQEACFANNPGDVQRAVDLACSVAAELERQCAEADCRLLFVYLPPPTRGQPALHAEVAAEAARVIGLSPGELDASERIADGWLRFLGERGIPALDLRPAFRATDVRLYWRADHHLNLDGHRLVAELVKAKLDELLGD